MGSGMGINNGTKKHNIFLLDNEKIREIYLNKNNLNEEI